MPTASGDALSFEEQFRDAFPDTRAEATVLSLFRREVDDLGAFLLNQDVVYVGGGSTANLLAVWRAHGLDRAIRAAYDAGVVLAGVSAGMNCWYEASVTDSFQVDTSRPLYDGATSRRGAHAFRVTLRDGRVREEALSAAILTGQSSGGHGQ